MLPSKQQTMQLVAAEFLKDECVLTRVCIAAAAGSQLTKCLLALACSEQAGGCRLPLSKYSADDDYAAERSTNTLACIQQHGCGNAVSSPLLMQAQAAMSGYNYS
jgi:hypothetical protein